MASRADSSGGLVVVLRTLAIVVALVAAAEVGTRNFVASPSNAVFHPILGSTQLPNRWSVNGREGFSRFMTNSFGGNDDEPAVDAQHRVVVHGDSFVRAIEVDRSDNFTTLVEHALPNVDVLNAGVAGFDPALELVAFDELHSEYPADLVVFTVNTEDIGDMLGGGFQLVRDPAGRVVDIDYAEHSPDALRWKLAPLLRHSALITEVLRRFNGPARKSVARLTGGVSAARNGFAAPVKTPEKAAKPPRLSDQDLTDVTAFVLRRIAARCNVIVLYIPVAEYHADRAVEFAAEAEQARSIFESAAAAAHVRFVDAGPSMERSYAQTGTPPVGFHNTRLGQGHLNVSGHRAVAELLAPVIEESLP